jgi:hypothetical protein
VSLETESRSDLLAVVNNGGELARSWLWQAASITADKAEVDGVLANLQASGDVRCAAFGANHSLELDILVLANEAFDGGAVC